MTESYVAMAMADGVPATVTKDGATPETIQEFITGLSGDLVLWCASARRLHCSAEPRRRVTKSVALTPKPTRLRLRCVLPVAARRGEIFKSVPADSPKRGDALKGALKLRK